MHSLQEQVGYFQQNCGGKGQACNALGASPPPPGQPTGEKRRSTVLVRVRKMGTHLIHRGRHRMQLRGGTGFPLQERGSGTVIGAGPIRFLSTYLAWIQGTVSPPYLFLGVPSGPKMGRKPSLGLPPSGKHKCTRVKGTEELWTRTGC